jgi:UDP-glucuronate 4-epimerase
MNILITGSAGFIGFHLTKKIMQYCPKDIIIGLDNLNNYYDVNLKKKRLKIVNKNKNYIFHKIDIRNKKKIFFILKKYKPKIIINLAAQAGVRYSILNPQAYIDSNVSGFLNILENAARLKIDKIIYASSSSVYGKNKKLPFSEIDKTDSPISMYAVTKKTNELMASCYSELYKMKLIGLRFFTAYGTFGRPDMSLFKFVDLISKNKKIDVYNYGNMRRDFTYVDDLVYAILKIVNKLKTDNRKKSYNEILNIGNNSPSTLKQYINFIEKFLKKKAKKNKIKLQKGDVKSTYADNNKLYKFIGYRPNTKIEKGIKNFVNWYEDYFFKK